MIAELMLTIMYNPVIIQLGSDIHSTNSDFVSRACTNCHTNIHGSNSTVESRDGIQEIGGEYEIKLYILIFSLATILIPFRAVFGGESALEGEVTLKGQLSM